MAFATLIARDGFNRADTSNIDGSTADGDGNPTYGIGTWAEHPVEPGPGYTGIRIESSDAVSGVTFYAIYTLSGTGVDPVQHAAETLLNFPAFDVPSTYVPCPCAPAGVGFYHGPGNPERYGSGFSEHWRLWFERPPAGTVITWETTWPTGIFWKLYYEVQGDGTTAKIYEDLTGHPTVGPLSHSLIQTFTTSLYCNFVEFSGVNSHAFKAFWGAGSKSYGTTATITGVPAVSYDATGATLNTTNPANNCGTSASGESGYTEVLVRCDGTVEDNYALGAVFDHSPGTTPTVTLQLWAAVASNYTLMHTHGPFGVNHDDPQLMRLEITTGNILRAYWAGVEVFTFDIATDVCEDPVGSAPVVASGRPGMSFIQPDSRFIRIQRFSVYDGSLDTDFPCEGPPDNPWPWNPPPPSTSTVFSLWVRKNNAWNFVPVEQLHPKFRGQYRNVDTLAPPQVYYRGAWRNIIGQNEMAPPDEPPGEPPPFFDPCELLPPLPPPPEGTVTPIPITGRFIGSQAWPVTQMGPVANGSKRSQGSVSASLVELSQATARGSVIMGAQGNYRQYLLNGRWNRDYFIDLTVSHLSPMLSQLVTYTGSGTYFGYSAIDDFDSHSLWPPTGVPDTDMAYVFSALHSQLPGIRLGMRGRPSQFSFDPGADFYEAQYKSWMGLTADQFASLEYNGARSRGALCCLNLNYLHGGNGSSGLRWNDGSGLGQSSHNFICSPTEVVDYLTAMFDRASAIDGAKFLAGSVGYMYDPFWIGIPGMLNAITIARNVMAMLPAP